MTHFQEIEDVRNWNYLR